MKDIFDVIYRQPEMQSLSLMDRIDFLTRYFLGKPFLHNPQGEGENGEVDTAPLYRFDGFDCVTFVNNVLALAYSHNKTDFLETLLKLNYYQATPLFQNRFHFMSMDWNPENQQQGFITDITETFHDKNRASIAVYAEGEIDKCQWLLRQAEQREPLKAMHLKALSVNYRARWIRMAYLPMMTLLENPSYFHQFPAFGLVEIVRPNWQLREKIGTNLHVSHIGFFLKKSDGMLMFRHATSQKGLVMEIPLWDYLDEMREVETVKGIAVFTLRKS